MRSIKYIVGIVIIVTMFISCSPLKKIQKTGTIRDKTVDNSTETLIRKEIEQQIGSISQIIIEYYPQKECDTLPIISITTSETPQKCDTLSTLPTMTTPKVNQPIKRIIKTEVKTATERTTAVDSTNKKDVVHTIDNDYTEKITEKAPPATQTIKWIAIALLAILLIILIVKFI